MVHVKQFVGGDMKQNVENWQKRNIMESSSLFTFKFNQRFPRGEEQGGGGGGGGVQENIFTFMCYHIFTFIQSLFLWYPRGRTLQFFAYIPVSHLDNTTLDRYLGI